MKVQLLILKFTSDVYIAPPSILALLFSKIEFSILKLPMVWTNAPPKLAFELENLEFAMCIFNPGSTLPSISIAPPSFFDVSFSNVQLFISPDITSLSPIAPPVSPAFKFLKEEPSIDIFP